MYQEQMHCRGSELFHRFFGTELMDFGFTRDSDGYYIANVEGGYIISVVLRPNKIGDIVNIYIDLNPVSEGWRFLTDEIFGKRICSGDNYSMLNAFIGMSVAFRESGNLEFFVEKYHSEFIDKVLPVIRTIYDEKSCYEAIKLLDEIFPDQRASSMYMSAIAFGDYKAAKRILRKIIRKNEDWQRTNMDEYKHLLNLLDEKDIGSLNSIVDEERRKARERYVEYMKHKE